MGLRRVDDEYEQVATALFGDGAWELVKKRDEQKKQGLSGADKALVASNAFSAGLGVAAINTMRGQAKGNLKRTLPQKERGGMPRQAARATAKLRASKNPVLRKVGAGGASAYRGMTRLGNKKAGAALVGAGLIGGSAFNAAADVGSAVSIAAKGKEKEVKKSDDLDFTIRGEISKSNDRRQVFGWASIVEINGEPVVDLQGDYMAIDVIEKAAYDYVHSSRRGGDMHRDGSHVSDLIESMVITPEKKEQLGLPPETPTGWWVGFQVNDDEIWQMVKDGKRPEFSIHGSGNRVDVEL